MANGYHLHQSLLRRNMRLLVLMLDHGADINSRNEDEMTLLHVAAKQQFVEGVEMLLERGANVNVTDKAGNTPLHYGIEIFKIVSALLAKGASPDCVNFDQEGPLHFAVRRRNVPVVTLLVNAGENLTNIKTRCCYSILHLSVSLNFPEIVKLLINNGAHVNVKTDQGLTPLHIAAEKNSFSIVKLLLESGADPNIIEHSWKSPKRQLENYPLYKMANFNPQGTTALHYAANKNSKIMTQLLLDYGANPNIMDNVGETPLHKIMWLSFNFFNRSDSERIAEMNKRLEVAELLLKSGAIVNIKGTTTPFHLSVHYRESRMLKLLIKYGADVDVKNFEGKTPLHTALYFGNEINIPVLLDCGASVDMVNNDLLSKKLGNETIALIFTRHSVKRQCINLVCNKIANWKNSEPFQKSCLDELNNMKEIKHGTHSVFDILSKYDDPYFVSNSLLEQEIIDGEGKFPIYHLVLYTTFLRAKRRYNMLNEVQEYFNVHILPQEIKRKILSYFSDEDLKSVIKAVKN